MTLISICSKQDNRLSNKFKFKKPKRTSFLSHSSTIL